jgi:hypothetical protein
MRRKPPTKPAAIAHDSEISVQSALLISRPAAKRSFARLAQEFELLAAVKEKNTELTEDLFFHLLSRYGPAMFRQELFIEKAKKWWDDGKWALDSATRTSANRNLEKIGKALRRSRQGQESLIPDEVLPMYELLRSEIGNIRAEIKRLRRVQRGASKETIFDMLRKGYRSAELEWLTSRRVVPPLEAWSMLGFQQVGGLRVGSADEAINTPAEIARKFLEEFYFPSDEGSSKQEKHTETIKKAIARFRRKHGQPDIRRIQVHLIKNKGEK